jgi:hypothetical protein
MRLAVAAEAQCFTVKDTEVVRLEVRFRFFFASNKTYWAIY